MTTSTLKTLAAALAFSTCLAKAPAARADDEVVLSTRTAERGSRHSIFGIGLDVGFPSFAGASLLVRPLSFLRLQGGAQYNYAGWGFSGGVSLQPHWIIAPSVGIEAGRFATKDLHAKMAARGVDVPEEYRAGLQDFGFTYASATAGIEIGHPDRFVVFVRGGMSRLLFASEETVNAIRTAVESGDVPELARFVRTSGREALIPTVKSGIMMFF